MLTACVCGLPFDTDDGMPEHECVPSQATRLIHPGPSTVFRDSYQMPEADVLPKNFVDLVSQVDFLLGKIEFTVRWHQRVGWEITTSIPYNRNRMELGPYPTLEAAMKAINNWRVSAGISDEPMPPVRR